jgi:hypothetical protein
MRQLEGSCQWSVVSVSRRTDRLVDVRQSVVSVSGQWSVEKQIGWSTLGSQLSVSVVSRRTDRLVDVRQAVVSVSGQLSVEKQIGWSTLSRGRFRFRIWP